MEGKLIGEHSKVLCSQQVLKICEEKKTHNTNALSKSPFSPPNYHALKQIFNLVDASEEHRKMSRFRQFSK